CDKSAADQSAKEDAEVEAIIVAPSILNPGIDPSHSCRVWRFFSSDGGTLEGYTPIGTHREPAQAPPAFRGTTWKTSRSVQLESRRWPVRVPDGARHEAGF